MPMCTCTIRAAGASCFGLLDLRVFSFEPSTISLFLPISAFGSNDRNCERNENRNNGNRLFDSQNNAKGGCERFRLSHSILSALRPLLRGPAYLPKNDRSCDVFLIAIWRGVRARARVVGVGVGPKRPPPHNALCPCPNVRAIRRAHLSNAPCRASHPTPPPWQTCWALMTLVSHMISGKIDNFDQTQIMSHNAHSSLCHAT